MPHWNFVDWLAGLSAAVQFLLALLGIAVSLHEDWAKKHRWWLLSTFSTLGLGGIFVTIAQSAKSGGDAATASSKLTTALGHLTDATSETNRVTSLNTQLQMQLIHSSDQIVDLSDRVLRNITGGGQYCYLKPLSVPPDLGPAPRGQIGLFVFNSGTLPLERCFIVIRDNSPIKSSQDFAKRFQPLMVRDLGPISPNIHNQGIGTNIFLSPGSYSIRIYTRNDIFFEDFTIGADLIDSNKIEIRDFNGKLLHSY